MSYDPANISLQDIKESLPKLSKSEILELNREIHEYLETSLLMRAAETSFSEWGDPEEDIYDTEL
jgi:hypothetical protein